MNHYYHIDSSKDVTESSLVSKKIERDVQAFLAIKGNIIQIIPFGVSSISGKGNEFYRTSKSS